MRGKWYFFRHGQSVANTQKVYNPLDDPLTELGEGQVRAAKEYVQALHVDAVYCSDLPRARQSAALLGLTPIFTASLADRVFGVLAGQPRGELDRRSAQAGVPADTYVPEGGESIEQSFARMDLFFDTLPPGNYLFITHGAVFEHLAQRFAGRPWTTVKVLNASLWVVEDGVLTHENWRPWEETNK